jgi:hypothetical protein
MHEQARLPEGSRRDESPRIILDKREAANRTLMALFLIRSLQRA